MNWQHVGAFLTGVAALVTAVVGFYDKLPFTNWSENSTATLSKKIREYGIVDDKDGWTNLRMEPSTDSTVLAKILNGTNLEVLDKKENWFKVSTESGRIGYVYKDKLLLVTYEK